VVLRSDPAHKLINATLYRLDEARACWERVTAPVLWVDAAASETVTRMRLTPADLAERRAAFKNLTYRTVADAGHMLHHDQPEEVARLIEAVPGLIKFSLRWMSATSYKPLPFMRSRSSLRSRCMKRLTATSHATSAT
jgi:hypothetical protein